MAQRLKMNKGLRNQITRIKHKQRCYVLGLNPDEHYCYKAQGTPCSCFMCRPAKYSRKIKHKKNNSK